MSLTLIAVTTFLVLCAVTAVPLAIYYGYHAIKNPKHDGWWYWGEERR